MIAMPRLTSRPDAGAIGDTACACLKIEIQTYPKPGLVSRVDTGAHEDMNAAMMERSADALRPFFADLAYAGATGAPMSRLRAIGVAAEVEMMAVTGGINTHRGAIFGMGLLCAAAGFRQQYGVADTLGAIVVRRWGDAIQNGPVALHSHGATVKRRHAAGGARAEAAYGFPSLYQIAMPALVEGHGLAPSDQEAAFVHTLMALIAGVADTNLLYRGGVDGLIFAQAAARTFLDSGSVRDYAWRARAVQIHHEFTARRLSPGGCADLLAMALFVEAMNE